MKLCCKITVCLLLGVLSTRAQAPFIKQVSAIIAPMPATTGAQLDSLLLRMNNLGEQGLTNMAALLSPKPLVNRVQLQYALNSYGAYITQANLEDKRTIAVKAYVNALKKVPDPESKAFLITQLQHMGDESAVPALAVYLLNPLLCDPAARALTQIDGGKAKVALVKALPKATNVNCKISIVAALGALRYLSSLDAITKLATTATDFRLRREALHAIAAIASPGSVNVMLAAAEKVHYRFEPTNAVASCLLYAQTMAGNWPQEPAEQVAGKLLQRCTGDSLMPVRIAAMNIMADIMQEDAVSLLEMAVVNGPAPYRAAALRIAAKYMRGEATGQWISIAKKLTGEPKAGVITLLGDTHQRMAESVCNAAIRDTDLLVKLAGIHAIGQLNNPDAVSWLIYAIKTTDTTVIKAVTTVLLSIKGPDVLDRCGAFLCQVPPPAQLGLLQVLAGRKARGQLYPMLQLFKQHTPEVQDATLLTLDKIGGQPLLETAAGKLPAEDSTLVRQYIALHYR